MNAPDERFEYLLSRYLQRKSSPEEIAEFFSLLKVGQNYELLESAMENEYKQIVPSAEVHSVDWDLMYNEIVSGNKPKPVKALWNNSIKIAAAILVVLSFGFLFWLRSTPQNSAIQTALQKDDIAPGGKKAILKLSDGREIVLDENGVLSSQGGNKIKRTAEGMVIYDEDLIGGNNVEMAGINVLTTPMGGQYMVILPDGTKVWLNSGSSLSFPSYFIGDSRNVSIQGEAYFEVSKDKTHPFKVQCAGTTVTVLGTHFNIMSYSDEPVREVSLAEGSVRVDNGKNMQTLLPGEQARINSETEKINLKKIDPDDIASWKDGIFQFDNTPIEQVMRQLKRWYNIEVVYEENKPGVLITGIVSKSNKISKILDLLRESSGLDFVIKDKQIIVKNGKEAYKKK